MARLRFECVVPRRVLVRIRAEFRTPTSLQRGATATPLKSGYLSIRSESGRPLVYAEVFQSGKARLFRQLRPRLKVTRRWVEVLQPQIGLKPQPTAHG